MASATGAYKAQYQVRFAQSGLNGDVGTATVLTVNSSNKQFSTLPYTDWFDAGSITCSYGRRWPGPQASSSCRLPILAPAAA